MDNLVGEGGKPLSRTRGRASTLRTSAKISLENVQSDRIHLNQNEPCARNAFASGSALNKHHAVEDRADLRSVTAHRLSGYFVPDRIRREPKRKAVLALRR